MKKCAYYGCPEPAAGPPPEGRAWHLCTKHQAERDALIAGDNPRALLGWWARGSDKKRVAREIAKGAARLFEQLQRSR